MKFGTVVVFYITNHFRNKNTWSEHFHGSHLEFSKWPLPKTLFGYNSGFSAAIYMILVSIPIFSYLRNPIKLVIIQYQYAYIGILKKISNIYSTEPHICSILGFTFICNTNTLSYSLILSLTCEHGHFFLHSNLRWCPLP